LKNLSAIRIASSVMAKMHLKAVRLDKKLNPDRVR